MIKDIYKKGLIVLGVIVVVIITFLGYKMNEKNNMLLQPYDELESEKGKTSEELKDNDEDLEKNDEEIKVVSTIIIDISGAVENPGIYELEEGTRLNDAIEAAGGLTEDVNSDYVAKNVNKARVLNDEEKIYIPFKDDDLSIVEKITSDDSAKSNNSKNTNANSGKININTASKEELITLNGIGDAFAQRIIDYRESKKFTKIEEIKNVKGVGEKTFEKIKDKITVDWLLKISERNDNIMSIKEVKLTQMTKTAGWAAKIGPETLAQVLCKLPKFKDDNLIVGIETSDDAAVYKITDDIAIIQTVDFFTPIVDDPYTFGQIAAANSLSDVYAMGGEPRLALNIVGFPNCLDPSVLAEILKGGASKVIEAGATLAGGHSIEDDEPKYGLCVTGFVNPNKIFKNYGAKPGDVLILTKQIGSGIVNTAVKADMASKKAVDEAIIVMTSLNKKAKEVIESYDINSCTDITGFGLIGHGIEMAEGSNVSFEIDANSVPIIDGAIEFAQMGLIPGGAYNNRAYFDNKVEVNNVDEEYIDLFFDPQTSGGLLISVAEKDAENVINDMKNKGLDTKFAIIGRVVEKKDKYIYFK